MMSIIMTITLICASVAAFLLLVVLLAPFRFFTEFAMSTEARSGTFFASWIHPRMVGIRYDIAHDLAELTIFGRRLKTKARDADAQEKTGKQTGSSKETVTEKKESALEEPTPVQPTPVQPTPAQPAQQTIKPSIPAANVPPESFTSTASGDKNDLPHPSTWSRFAQFRKRMVSYWRKLQATWRILQRHHMASRALRWCMRLLSLSLRVVRFDHVRINVKAGMEDPAELGKIYGWYAAGNRLLFGSRKNIVLRFEPQFMRNSLAFDGSIGIRTSAASVLMPIVIALLTFPWLRAFFVWRRLKTVYRVFKT